MESSLPESMSGFSDLLGLSDLVFCPVRELDALFIPLVTEGFSLDLRKFGLPCLIICQQMQKCICKLEQTLANFDEELVKTVLRTAKNI